ncbi:cytochrome P450 2J6-like [Strongylocentrotus purpuratus]|uniref:Cytochrome P450 n=1 Tax=Strongylocentrotus purpuratus TaxID=7668 RepID=A0A7M7NIS5_STRPU|nr:cytochrome P450 2J6-like [Strongylocentrotus purpuratus]
MFGLSVSATSVLLGALMFLIFVWFVRRPRNLPPGPWSWPVIGYRFRSGPLHEAYMDMAKKYGPIFSLRRGPFLVVVLNDIATIKQAFVKSSEFFQNRFVPGHIRWGVRDTNKNASIVWSSGKPWKDHRKFSLHALRSFGFGKKSLVPQINLEARYLADEIKNLRGAPSDLSPTLNKATANVVAQLVFGRRYEYDDLQYIEVLQAMVAIFAGISITDPVVVFESLIHTPWYKHYRDATFKARDFIMCQLYMHRDTFQKDNIRDYVDAFLADDISKEYTLEEFWRIVLDLFAAGTETTTLVTSWAILYLAVHPDVQNKVQNELDRVVGRGRQPTTTDRPDLPYCDATLMEVMRPRECLGIQLARMESFLLFTNLFQQFEFKLPSDQPTASLRGQPGLSMHPHPYHVCAIER